jgi:hypothetical protein
MERSNSWQQRIRVQTKLYRSCKKPHQRGQFILIDKKDPAKPIKARSTNALICEIPLDDLHYDGLRNDTL